MSLFLVGCNSNNDDDGQTEDTTEPSDNSNNKYNTESWKSLIPNSCLKFNDGCNECIRDNEKDTPGCTKKFCEIYQKPFCLDDTEISKDCMSFYDGCNDCHREEPGGKTICTEKACSKYEKAYCKD